MEYVEQYNRRLFNELHYIDCNHNEIQEGTEKFSAWPTCQTSEFFLKDSWLGHSLFSTSSYWWYLDIQMTSQLWPRKLQRDNKVLKGNIELEAKVEVLIFIS